MKFEGTDITDFEVVLPRVTVEGAGSYKRGSVLRFQVEARVKGVRLEETKDETLKRQHVMEWESIELVEQFEPGDYFQVEGSASEAAQEAQEAEDEAQEAQEPVDDASDAMDMDTLVRRLLFPEAMTDGEDGGQGPRQAGTGA